MKKMACIIFLFALFYSTLNAQITVKDKNKNSVFADFEQLGMQKEDFLKQFGLPTTKDLYVDENNHAVEVLYYAEILEKGNVIVVTGLTFSNNQLLTLKSQINANLISKNDIEKLIRDVSFISHQVLLKK